jgi:tripartite-type tricarboxylate transporter receptor subunit TctC
MTMKALAGLLTLAATAIPAQAADPFYKGKTINFIVGFAPGGGSDLTCRVFANHIGRHIAGNPTIVVRNMPGASGANAANFVGEAARNDGLTALCGTISIALPLLNDRASRAARTSSTRRTSSMAGSSSPAPRISPPVPPSTCSG